MPSSRQQLPTATAAAAHGNDDNNNSIKNMNTANNATAASDAQRRFPFSTALVLLSCLVSSASLAGSASAARAASAEETTAPPSALPASPSFGPRCPNTKRGGKSARGNADGNRGDGTSGFAGFDFDGDDGSANFDEDYCRPPPVDDAADANARTHSRFFNFLRGAVMIENGAGAANGDSSSPFSIFSTNPAAAGGAADGNGQQSSDGSNNGSGGAEGPSAPPWLPAAV